MTHDYLVPSLREWLTKKQRETARGRAEMRLDEFSQLWNDKPGPQRLPGLLEWASIRTLTRKTAWTAPQRKMMAAAGRRIGAPIGHDRRGHGGRGVGGNGRQSEIQAQRLEGMVDQLATAEVANVPEIVTELEPVAIRRWRRCCSPATAPKTRRRKAA